MHQKELGIRLKKARESTGLTQESAANIIAVPRTAITQIESGNRSVSTLELTKFAEAYHRTVSYFLNESKDSDEDMLVALYRIVPGIESDTKIQNQVSLYNNWCREGSSLERLLGHERRSEPPIYSESTPQSAKEASAQGERVAKDERRRLGIGHTPISDIAELVSKQSIWTSGVAFPDSMSGLFLRHSSIGLAILVNSTHSAARKRFSYAHEYAHALLDRELETKISDKSNSADLIEKRANAFAAAFLMPPEGIEAFLDSLGKGSGSDTKLITYNDIALIARHFAVSYDAAIFRLHNLGYISKLKRDELMGQAKAGKEYLKILKYEDMDKPTTEELDEKELRNRIVHLAVEAYHREEISRGKLLDLGKSLQIPTDKMLILAETTSAH